MENTKENQDLVKLIIERNIESDDVEKVQAALSMTIEVDVPADVRIKGYTFCGEHHFQKKDFVSAFYYFNKARTIDLFNNTLISKTLSVLFNFFEQFQDHFSKDDLELLLRPVEQLTDYYKIKSSVKIEFIDSLRELQHKINYYKKYKASDQLESKATFKVQQIYDAFSNDMTFDEMINEFSRMAALMIFEDVEEKENSEDKKKENSEDKKKEGDVKKPSPTKEMDDEGVDE